MSFSRDIADVNNYAVDWTAQLDEGETITTATAVADTGATLTVTQVSKSGGRVAFWVSGGTLNTAEDVEVTIVTSTGRTLNQSARFRTVDR